MFLDQVGELRLCIREYREDGRRNDAVVRLAQAVLALSLLFIEEFLMNRV